MVHAVEGDRDYFSSTMIGLEILQANVAVLCCLWMMHLGKLSPTIQAGHLQSVPFGARISFPFKKNPTDFPAAELVVFFS